MSEILPIRRPTWQAFLAGVGIWVLTVIGCAALAVAAPLQWLVPIGFLVSGIYWRNRAPIGLAGFSPRQVSNIAFTIGALAIIAAAAPANKNAQRRSTAIQSVPAGSKTEAQALPTEDISGMRENPENFVELDDIRWHNNYGMMELSVTIKNTSKLELKDFIIKCEHSGSSGTVMDSNRREIYEIIAPGKSKRIRGFNMGFINSQAVSTACEVLRASIVE